MSEIADIPGMDDGWRKRLFEAVKTSGKSQRAISIAAGLNPGYVNSIFKEGKDPTISNLVDVCAEIGVSLSFVLYGYEMTAEAEQILRLLEDATPGERAGLLQILRERQPRRRRRR